MFKTILIPTDGSHHAYRALEIASDIADRYSAKLIILHVQMHGEVPAGFRQMDQATHANQSPVSINPGLYNYPGNLATAFDPPEADTGEDNYYEYLGQSIIKDSREKALQHGVKNIESKMIKGDTTDSIINFAEAENADLVVIGTRGLGELKRLLTGSVASKVVQLAHCPCLTVK